MADAYKVLNNSEKQNVKHDVLEGFKNPNGGKGVSPVLSFQDLLAQNQSRNQWHNQGRTKPNVSQAIEQSTQIPAPSAQNSHHYDMPYNNFARINPQGQNLQGSSLNNHTLEQNRAQGGHSDSNSNANNVSHRDNESPKQESQESNIDNNTTQSAELKNNTQQQNSKPQDAKGATDESNSSIVELSKIQQEESGLILTNLDLEQAEIYVHQNIVKQEINNESQQSLFVHTDLQDQLNLQPLIAEQVNQMAVQVAEEEDNTEAVILKSDEETKSDDSQDQEIEDLQVAVLSQNIPQPQVQNKKHDGESNVGVNNFNNSQNFDGVVVGGANAGAQQIDESIESIVENQDFAQLLQNADAKAKTNDSNNMSAEDIQALIKDVNPPPQVSQLEQDKSDVASTQPRPLNQELKQELKPNTNNINQESNPNGAAIAAPQQSSEFSGGDKGKDQNQNSSQNQKSEIVHVINGGIASAKVTAAPATDFKTAIANQKPAEQVRIYIQEAIKTGDKHMVVRLNPEDLGEIVIRTGMKDGILKVDIRVQNEKAYEIIAKDLSMLKSVVQEAAKSESATLDFGRFNDQAQQQQSEERQTQNPDGSFEEILTGKPQDRDEERVGSLPHNVLEQDSLIHIKA